MIVKIYLAGGMRNCSIEDQVKNRIYMYDYLTKSCRNVDVFNPYLYYNYQNSFQESDKEVMRFELGNVLTSDVVIADFHEPSSLGTMAEITAAYLNGIPVIGLNEKEQELHPWQVEMSTRIFTDIDELLHHIQYYYVRE